MAGELSFFELGVQEPERARAFFEALFGWGFAPAGKGFQIREAGVRGGVHGGDPGGGPYLFFAVDDIEAAAARVRELGGTIEDVDGGGDSESESEFGRFRFCRDDQGTAFGLHQPPGQR